MCGGGRGGESERRCDEERKILDQKGRGVRKKVTKEKKKARKRKREEKK